MASAARSGSNPTSRPAAISASARCTAVSCAIRRAQKLAGRSWLNAQTGSPSASRTAPMTRAAPARSHGACCAGSSGNRPSGTWRNGMNSADRVLTISAAQRCARPTWVASCRSVQSGQVGTGVVRSAPSTSPASVSVLVSISSYQRSGLIGIAVLRRLGRAVVQATRPAPAGPSGLAVTVRGHFRG